MTVAMRESARNQVARFAAIVVFAGAVVLSTHILAPARTTPNRPSVRPDDLQARLDQSSPAVDQMNTEVEKLRERLLTPPSYPPPTRNPFRFGEPPEPPRPKSVAPVAPAIVTPPPPAPELPRLVAITSAIVDGAAIYSAVFAIGDDVHLSKVGETIAGLEIRSIAVDSVELAERATGATFKISLH